MRQTMMLMLVSAWTAGLCLRAVNRALCSNGEQMLSPSWRSVALAALGVGIWAGAALLAPVASLQVAGATVALVFSWEVAGVLERLVKPTR